MAFEQIVIEYGKDGMIKMRNISLVNNDEFVKYVNNYLLSKETKALVERAGESNLVIINPELFMSK